MLTVGTRVRVRDKTNKELNGRDGTCKEFNQHLGLWVVQFQSRADHAFKAENLESLDRAGSSFSAALGKVHPCLLRIRAAIAEQDRAGACDALREADAASVAVEPNVRLMLLHWFAEVGMELPPVTPAKQDVAQDDAKKGQEKERRAADYPRRGRPHFALLRIRRGLSHEDKMAVWKAVALVDRAYVPLSPQMRWMLIMWLAGSPEERMNANFVQDETLSAAMAAEASQVQACSQDASKDRASSSKDVDKVPQSTNSHSSGERSVVMRGSIARSLAKTSANPNPETESLEGTSKVVPAARVTRSSIPSAVNQQTPKAAGTNTFPKVTPSGVMPKAMAREGNPSAPKASGSVPSRVLSLREQAKALADKLAKRKATAEVTAHVEGNKSAASPKRKVPVEPWDGKTGIITSQPIIKHSPEDADGKDDMGKMIAEFRGILGLEGKDSDAEKSIPPAAPIEEQKEAEIINAPSSTAELVEATSNEPQVPSEAQATSSVASSSKRPLEEEAVETKELPQKNKRSKQYAEWPEEKKEKKDKQIPEKSSETTEREAWEYMKKDLFGTGNFFDFNSF